MVPPLASSVKTRRSLHLLEAYGAFNFGNVDNNAVEGLTLSTMTTLGAWVFPLRTLLVPSALVVLKTT